MKNYLEIFRNTGALLDGHFVLTSGRHSALYFQCAKVMQYPEHLLNFSKNIMDHFLDTIIDTVISPAVGGIVIGTEVGRRMNKKTIFAERENGEMTLRRGFSVEKGEIVSVEGDYCLVAVGRRAYTDKLGLENIGLETDKAGRVIT